MTRGCRRGARERIASFCEGCIEAILAAHGLHRLADGGAAAKRYYKMPIYERPTKSFMTDWAKEHLSPGQTFNKAAPAQWFAEYYPKIKRNTVNMHVEGMSVNLNVTLVPQLSLT